MSRTMFGWRSWRAERLTFRQIGSSAGISRCQTRTWRQASAMAHWPSGTISPRLLGERDELHRRHEAAARVLPADQRLDAGQAARLEVDEGW